MIYKLAILFNNMDSNNPYRIVEKPGQRILEVDYSKSIKSPTIENNSSVMADTIDKLTKSGRVNQIQFLQQEDIIYPYDQTNILVEISNIISDLENKKIFSESSVREISDNEPYPDRMEFLKSIVNFGLREEPIGVYLRLNSKINEELKLMQTSTRQNSESRKVFIKTLTEIKDSLEKTSIIKLAAPYFSEHKPNDRRIYSRIFNPIIKPNFLYAKLVTNLPSNSTVMESYNLSDGTKVSILDIKENIRPIYHIVPPELNLSEDKYLLLGEAKQVVSEHKPQKSEFIDPEKTRELFLNVEKDLLKDLSVSKGIKLTKDEINQLAEILVRYTLGFGLIEVILNDENIQDISINAPSNINEISIVHQKYGECRTNITLTQKETDAIATKLRLISGRPLDEANPVLDTNLILPNSTARVAAIQEPISPDGMAFSFRRHREKPWTYPLFIKNKMINPLAAGLLSFLIDGSRTILIAGTRSSGKTSFLSSSLVELMRSTRILTIEDTLELPIRSYQKLNYDIQSMKVQSVLSQGSSEMTAEDGIRAALRLGDSALIVGEVRSKEATALYEAMRVGALANVVMGTIHGDSPYSIFDRVVNDLKVPKTSFKATDIIVVANPVKTASGLDRKKRIVQISEVKKEWTDDPLKENGFLDLMIYNPETDQLEPTDALIQGESEVLKNIASKIPEWAGDWDAVYNNILLRAKIKQKIVDISEKDESRLEAEFTILCNDMFHKISKEIYDRSGKTDPEKIYSEWEDWLNKWLMNSKTD